MELLVNQRAAVDGAAGAAALSCAVASGQTEAAVLLSKSGAAAGTHSRGNSLPLEDAISQGSVDTVRELLAAGCSVNTQSKSFESPLDLAVKNGHVDVLRLLVKHGYDVNAAQRGSGVTALHVAVDQHHCPRLFRALLEELLAGVCDLDALAYTTLETPLYRAVNFQKTALARLLLYHGANPNVSCPFDITLLQVVCRQQDVRLVKALLNLGVEWRREAWLKFFFFLEGEATANPEVNALLKQWRLQPVPLHLLCRIRLRTALGHNLPAKVACLPIPPLSKKFLLMEDLLS